MKKLAYTLLIASSMLLSCEDDELEVYCISGVNPEGNRVTLNCAIKERVDATIAEHPDYTDIQVHRVDSCADCQL